MKRRTNSEDALRQGIAAGCVALAFGGAAMSQVHTQLVRSGDILGKEAKLKRVKKEQNAQLPRGAFISRDGRVLGQSEEVYELNLYYKIAPKSPGFYLALSAATGLPESELRAPAMAGSTKNLTWFTHLSTEQATAVRTVKKRWDADGVDLKPALSRTYPLAEGASDLIGSIRNGQPNGGLEQSLDSFLQGKGELMPGVTGVTDKLRAEIERANEDGEAGRTVTLTIDSQIQAIASDAIRRAVEKSRATDGCALVMDPKTGDLLAVADWPSADPRPTAKGSSGFNEATMTVLEPGSTFKLFTLAKALTDKKITSTTPSMSTAYLDLGYGNGVSNHDNLAFGSITPEKAIAVSCNVTAAKWAAMIGRRSYVKFLEDTGILERPQLGMPLERAGLFNKNDGGRIIQLANLGFGQAIAVSPVNLIGAFGMIANEGVLMKPRLIKSLGGVEIPPVRKGRYLDPEAAKTALKFSQSVIHAPYGTGNHLNVPGIRLAGKTGTAQKVRAKGKISGHVANFVGFVPAEKPQYVVLVMVNQPRGKSYYGGAVAGPAFVDIVKGLISTNRLRPDAKLEAAERYNDTYEADPALPAARD